MTINPSIAAELQSLSPSAQIEMYEIDATVLGDTVYRFHSGKNEITQDIVWQGNTYNAFPIVATGFELTGRGVLPRPKLRVANVLGTMSALVLAYADLAGCKVTRIRTLVKFLDAVNFGSPRNKLFSTDDLGTGWVRGSGLSSVVDGVADPFGGTAATQFNGLTGSSVTSTLATVYRPNTPVVVGNKYTISVWVNPLTSGTFIIRYGATANAQTKAFPLTAGSGWQRISATFTAGSSGGTASPCLFGASAAMNVQLFGAQFEDGEFMTEYVPVASTFNPNPNADPTAEYPRDVYFVDRKSTETRDYVEFELSAALDLAGVRLPRRQIIQNYCPWLYRGAECGYTGTSYFDTNDATVPTLAQDVCGKRLTSCQARFGSTAELPYGGFPAAGLIRQ